MKANKSFKSLSFLGILAWSANALAHGGMDGGGEIILSPVPSDPFEYQCTATLELRAAVSVIEQRYGGCIPFSVQTFAVNGEIIREAMDEIPLPEAKWKHFCRETRAVGRNYAVRPLREAPDYDLSQHFAAFAVTQDPRKKEEWKVSLRANLIFMQDGRKFGVAAFSGAAFSDSGILVSVNSSNPFPSAEDPAAGLSLKVECERTL